MQQNSRIKPYRVSWKLPRESTKLKATVSNCIALSSYVDGICQDQRFTYIQIILVSVVMSVLTTYSVKSLRVYLRMPHICKTTILFFLQLRDCSVLAV